MDYPATAECLLLQSFLVTSLQAGLSQWFRPLSSHKLPVRSYVPYMYAGARDAFDRDQRSGDRTVGHSHSCIEDVLDGTYRYAK